MRITIDIKKSVQENAAFYYERSKRSRKKIDGAKLALQKTEKELEKLERTKQYEEKIQESKKQRKKEWYEKFHWFYSSDNFLCIGGKDQTTNDIAVKKYMEDKDIVFHTEAPGSPFFIIKTEGKKVPEQTIKETAQATASFSKAWTQGITTTEVYNINPEQVKIELGLPKGTFMIHGKRNYLTLILELAIGIYEGKVMCAPLSCIKTHCKHFLTIKQGFTKKSDAAKKIKKFLEDKYSTKIELDEVMQVLPAGDIKIE